MSIANEKLHSLAEQLLNSATLNPTIQGMTPLTGGRNNRAYKLVTPDATYCLKCYNTQRGDPRNRLLHERAFLAHCHNLGLSNTATLITHNTNANAALFKWIDGAHYHTVSGNSSPDRSALETALSFFEKLNGHNNAPSAICLPNAADSCFSPQQYLSATETRIRYLTAIPETTTLHSQASAWCKKKLIPLWGRLEIKIKKAYAQRGIPLTASLRTSQRCISPSDFGYHNTLHTQGKTYFIDFEYAGWDDPAKMVADFFCQPEHPPIMDDIHDFAAHALSLFSHTPQALDRLSWVLPLTQLKWCCLVLNEFHPDTATQRQYAYDQKDLVQHLAVQLEKSIAQYAKIELTDHEIRA